MLTIEYIEIFTDKFFFILFHYYCLTMMCNTIKYGINSYEKNLRVIVQIFPFIILRLIDKNIL